MFQMSGGTALEDWAECSVPSPAASETDPVSVLYIAGMGRSGSTLLGRILGRTPGHHPTGEVIRIFGRGMVRNQLCSCGSPARSCEFWGRVIEELEERTGIDRETVEEVDRFCRRVTEGPAAPLALASWKPASFRRRLAGLQALMYQTYRVVGEVSGGKVLVDTSKNLVWGRLLVDVPGIRVRVLHLLRDSRGVSFSYQKVRELPGVRSGRKYMERYPAFASSLLWNVDNLLAERLGKRADGHLRIRYRDFTHAPRRTLDRILEDGAGPGPGSHAIFRPGERTVDVSGQHILAGNPVRFEEGPIEIREDREWRRAMPRVQKAMVTALTAPLLRRYGYMGDGADSTAGTTSGS